MTEYSTAGADLSALTSARLVSRELMRLIINSDIPDDVILAGVKSVEGLAEGIIKQRAEARKASPLSDQDVRLQCLDLAKKSHGDISHPDDVIATAKKFYDFVRSDVKAEKKANASS